MNELENQILDELLIDGLRKELSVVKEKVAIYNVQFLSTFLSSPSIVERRNAYLDIKKFVDDNTEYTKGLMKRFKIIDFIILPVSDILIGNGGRIIDKILPMNILKLENTRGEEVISIKFFERKINIPKLFCDVKPYNLVDYMETYTDMNTNNLDYHKIRYKGESRDEEFLRKTNIYVEDMNEIIAKRDSEIYKTFLKINDIWLEKRENILKNKGIYN